MVLKCDWFWRVDRRAQTTLSSLLPFIFSGDLKDLKCANAKYDIKQAGISAQVSRFAVVLLIVSIPGCQFMAFQMPFSGRRAFSRQMHTAVIYLFICAHCCRDGLGDIYFSARIRACVWVCVRVGCEWGSVMRNAYQASTACQLAAVYCCPNNPTGRPRVDALTPNIPVLSVLNGSNQPPDSDD